MSKKKGFCSELFFFCEAEDFRPCFGLDAPAVGMECRTRARTHSFFSAFGYSRFPRQSVATVSMGAEPNQFSMCTTPRSLLKVGPLPQPLQ